ncbi:MAG: hypothetical protein WC712_15260 [Candidatus Brocadiia bacterium]
MRNTYPTADGKDLSLKALNADDKAFLGKLFHAYEHDENYLAFKHLYTAPGCQVYKHARRVGKPAAKTVLFQVCEDLARRLGMRQEYVVREDIAGYGSAGGPRRELTTGQVAAMAGCSAEAVRRAISSWRLPARMVGRLALVWEEDAKTFARKLRPYGRKRRKQAGRKELAHAPRRSRPLTTLYEAGAR